MTPEQIDIFTNAYVNVDAAIGTYGPVLAWACNRGIRAWTRCRQYRAQELREGRELGQEAALEAAVQARGRADLDTCNAILHATETREEKP